MYQTYNFLIIGRSGSGKSALTKFLTGDQKIKVMNSPNQVTKTIEYYSSTKAKIQSLKIQFGILDIPGLDNLHNRKIIRQHILKELQTRKLEIDGILYTIDCVARDTVDNKKIFNFLNDLPWSYKDIKLHLFPIFTKYDNLIFDGDDQNTKHTFQQFSKIFSDNNYGDSWKYNRMYWINWTKNIHNKMSINNQIKQTYQNQLDNLLKAVRRNKSKLTYQKIHIFLKQQEQYMQTRIKNFIYQKKASLRTVKCQINPTITLKIYPKKPIQNYTAGTLSSLGFILSVNYKNQLIKTIFFVGSALAAGFLAKNLRQNSKVKEYKIQQQPYLKLKYENNYIIQKVNDLIIKSLKDYQNQIRFEMNENDKLIIKLPNKFECDSFIVDQSQCSIDGLRLQKNKYGNFEYLIGEIQNQMIKEYEINIDLNIKIPQQRMLLQMLQKQSFNFKIKYDHRSNQDSI